jgi:hypothetical protein
VHRTELLEKPAGASVVAVDRDVLLGGCGSVDPTTGIAHKKVTNKQVGTLTFPSRL